MSAKYRGEDVYRGPPGETRVIYDIEPLRVTHSRRR
jgi:hypothetical protein